MHDGHDHDHHHPPAAPDEDTGPVSRFEVLETALRELLAEKGIVSAAEIRAQIDLMASKSPAQGAAVVARAWTDPAFRARLLADPRAALVEMGIDFGTIADLSVVENTADMHHVVVCTLCSCYPRGLLGVPPPWYKSAAYRARTVREPRAVLAEFGCTLPESCAVRVVDSTADLRFLVIPERPAGTEGWSAEALARLVTRDSMIGTARALAPGAA